MPVAMFFMLVIMRVHCPAAAPVCEDPTANNVGGALPCTYDPVCEDPTANNVGGALPCTYDPVCEDPVPTNVGGALPVLTRSGLRRS